MCGCGNRGLSKLNRHPWCPVAMLPMITPEITCRVGVDDVSFTGEICRRRKRNTDRLVRNLMLWPNLFDRFRFEHFTQRFRSRAFRRVLFFAHRSSGWM